MSENDATNAGQVNWKRVGLFLGATFITTYLLDYLLFRSGGLNRPDTTAWLQLQMCLPAFFAIFFGMFVFRDSPYHVGRRMPDGRPDRARGFFYLYMIMSILFAVATVLSVLAPKNQSFIATLRIPVLVAGTIGLLVFRISRGRESFARARLFGGRVRWWFLFGAAVVVFLAVQAALNVLTHLGKSPDLEKLVPAGPSIPLPMFLAAAGVQSIVGGSLLGIVLGFGEEFGWRGFLQGQLIRLGRRRGVLIVGLIWAAWHYPLIWMGYDYPGNALAGTVMMTVLCLLLAYVFGFIMLKTGSIWLVAFMHAVFDQTVAYIVAVINVPKSPFLSFGIGIYGLAMLAVVVGLLLRDNVWRGRSRGATASATGV